jgi:citrate synthase
MLDEIGSYDRVAASIARAKDETGGVPLVGFGHRIYQFSDPRAKVLQRICHELLDALGKRDDPVIRVGLELERLALADEYFANKGAVPE